MEHEFTGTGGTLPTRFKTPAGESETFVYVGQDGGFEDLGGGTLKIQKVAQESGRLSTLKEITSLTDEKDRAQRFILPPNQDVEITLTNATGASLGVEIQSGPRRNP